VVSENTDMTLLPNEVLYFQRFIKCYFLFIGKGLAFGLQLLLIPCQSNDLVHSMPWQCMVALSPYVYYHLYGAIFVAVTYHCDKTRTGHPVVTTISYDHKIFIK